MSGLRLVFGGLDLLLKADREIEPPDGESYRPFVSSADRGIGPDTIDVHLLLTESPRAEGRVIFESGAHWSILEDGTRRTFVDRDPSGTVLAVHFEPGSREVRVECAPSWVAPPPRRGLRCPLRYPVDQILAMYLLGRQGLVLHAAGALVRGRAVVLPGVSGAGKTTFLRLAGGREGWEPLSDDRVIVRTPDGADGVVAHGTPWPGEGRIASDRSGPVGCLAFLAQGPENRVEPLTPPQALHRLLAASSVPWYDSNRMGLTLEACDRLVRRVPARLLTFRPDSGAVDLVDHLMEEERLDHPPA